MAVNKTADVFSFSQFDPSKLSDSLREFSEKGLAQSKDAYSKMKTAAEEASKTIESTLQTAQNGSVELGLKAVEVLRTNSELTLSHLEALLTVKSVAELVELQTSFIRKQSEVTVEQAKTLQETVKKLGESIIKPGKEAAEKAVANFKTLS